MAVKVTHENGTRFDVRDASKVWSDSSGCSECIVPAGRVFVVWSPGVIVGHYVKGTETGGVVGNVEVQIGGQPYLPLDGLIFQAVADQEG